MGGADIEMMGMDRGEEKTVITRDGVNERGRTKSKGCGG